jgi:pyruvate dehydrogenase (quinone)
MSKKKVADIIIETLQEAGVQRCYGIVGDTLNHITDAIRRSDIEWVHMRHEEAGAMAAGGEALITGRLTACAGTCGPGSLHFINGLFEAHRSRAPVVLIATQVATSEMGMDFPQEVDLKPIYDTCSHFCAYIHSPAQARRVTALAAQAALNKRGAAVIIVPGDISQMEVEDGLAFRPHQPHPVLRPSGAELDEIAAVINAGKRVTLYCGSGCEGAEQEIVALAEKIKAPVAHTSRAKDFIEPYNPYNMGMTGILGVASAFAPSMHATRCCCSARISPGASSIRTKRSSSRSTATPPIWGAVIPSTSVSSATSRRPSKRCCRACTRARSRRSCATASSIASRRCSNSPKRSSRARTG